MSFLAAIRSIVGKKRATEAILSSQAFTDEVKRRLTLAGPGVQVDIVGDLELTMRQDDGEPGRVFLGNAYRTYLTAGTDDQSDVIDRYVRGFASASVGLAYDQGAIVPIIKAKEWLGQFRQSVAESGVENLQEQVYEELNNELIVVYAADTPDNISYLSPDDLAKLDIDRTLLRRQAVRNLRGIIPGLGYHRGERVTMVTAGGNYEASLILFEDLWARERERSRGEPVAAVPARDLLLFADSEDSEGCVELRELARQYYQDAVYAVTDKLFVYRNGRVEPWTA